MTINKKKHLHSNQNANNNNTQTVTNHSYNKTPTRNWQLIITIERNILGLFQVGRYLWNLSIRATSTLV